MAHYRLLPVIADFFGRHGLAISRVRAHQSQLEEVGRFISELPETSPLRGVEIIPHPEIPLGEAALDLEPFDLYGWLLEHRFIDISLLQPTGTATQVSAPGQEPPGMGVIIVPAGARAAMPPPRIDLDPAEFIYRGGRLNNVAASLGRVLRDRIGIGSTGSTNAPIAPNRPRGAIPPHNPTLDIDVNPSLLVNRSSNGQVGGGQIQLRPGTDAPPGDAVGVIRSYNPVGQLTEGLSTLRQVIPDQDLADINFQEASWTTTASVSQPAPTVDSIAQTIRELQAPPSTSAIIPGSLAGVSMGTAMEARVGQMPIGHFITDTGRESPIASVIFPDTGYLPRRPLDYVSAARKTFLVDHIPEPAKKAEPKTRWDIIREL